MKLVYTISFIVCTFFVHSQDVSTDLKRNVLVNYQSTNGVIYTRMLDVIDDLDSKNAFLLFEGWQEISVVDNSGNTVVIDSANYNIENDLMLFYKNDKLFYLYPNLVKEVHFKESIFRTFHSEEENKNLFFEALSEGDLTLLKRYDIKTFKSNTHPMGIQHNNAAPRKKQSEEFYYSIGDSEEIQLLPKKKKKFLLLFKKNRNRLLDFIRSNKLSNKKEEDLILIFDHYNLDLNNN